MVKARLAAKRLLKKQKHKLLSMPVEASSDDDVEVNEEDAQFLQEHLLGMRGGQKTVASRSASESESDYEEYERPSKRRFTENIQEREKLPVREMDGKWKARVERVKVESDEEEMEAESTPARPPSRPAANKPALPTDPILLFAHKRDDIGSLAASIIENPDHNVLSLKPLRQYLLDGDTKIVQLAMLTLYAVFRDILPGYRIRPLTDQERSAKVSKDVKRVRQYEEALVSQYHAYIQKLQDLVAGNLKLAPGAEDDQRDFSIAVVGVKCLCRMFLSASHFNFRSQLLAAIVKRSTTMLSAERSSLYNLDRWCIRDVCCQTIEQLFESDDDGELSLECVRLIGQLAKDDKIRRINPKVLETLLKLRLTVAMRSKGDRRGNKKHLSSNKNQYTSKKLRKTMKLQKEVEQEMKEAEAVVDQEEREANHEETLKQVFVIYFRVLKKYPSAGLLSPVLAGVVKFGHLISNEYFHDLVATIRQIIAEHGERLSVVDTLACVHCAFKLLGDQHGATTAAASTGMAVDLSDYYDHAHRQLRLAVESLQQYPDAKERALYEHRLVNIVCQSMEQMFLRRGMQQSEPVRAAACLKRLAVLSLNIHAVDDLLQLLNTMKSMLVRSPPRIWELVDTLDDEESPAMIDGHYLSEVDACERCHPFGTSLFELVALSRHSNSSVRVWVKELMALYRDTRKSLLGLG